MRSFHEALLETLGNNEHITRKVFRRGVLQGKRGIFHMHFYGIFEGEIFESGRQLAAIQIDNRNLRRIVGKLARLGCFNGARAKNRHASQSKRIYKQIAPVPCDNRDGKLKDVHNSASS